MAIAIIGAGKMGSALAKLFLKAGHQVALSNSRGPESLAGLVKDLGNNAVALSVNDAAKFGDIIVLATPWRKPEALPDAELVKDKIVVDAMNPYAEDGSIIDLGNTTSSEETAKRLPGSYFVKAFNTIYYKHLEEKGRTDLPLQERHAIFYAGDEQAAKSKLSRIIEEIGFAGVDTGSLHDGGLQQQPGAPLYNKEVTCSEALGMVVR